MGSTHFLMRGLQHVSTEMTLHVLAYNFKRLIKLPPLFVACHRLGFSLEFASMSRRSFIAQAALGRGAMYTRPPGIGCRIARPTS